MKKAKELLDAIRAFEIEKYDTEKEFKEKEFKENEFKEELNRIINEKYKGDFSTFMQKEVLNEDYGDLRFEVERLYRS